MPSTAVASLHSALATVAGSHSDTVLASSFGVEDMLLTHVIATARLPITLITLDTGRLPGETYALIDRTRERYGIPVEIYYPAAQQVETYVRANGVNAFYQSLDLRHACCGIRKVAPLARALAGRGAWITGLRRAQAASRDAVAFEEFDNVHGLPKFNPLADWSDDEVWSFVRANDVPYNPLHDRGFPSIGCAPCTRAIEPGEDIRAGRWWWERADARECGIHRRPLDVLPRIVVQEAA
jgi:phosphoadenosine phosphosulfate reductase